MQKLNYDQEFELTVIRDKHEDADKNKKWQQPKIN